MWRWNHIIQRLDIFCDFNDFIHFLNFSGFSDFSFLSTLTCGRLTGFGWIQEDALQIRVGGKRVPQTFFPPKVSSSNLFFWDFWVGSELLRYEPLCRLELDNETRRTIIKNQDDQDETMDPLAKWNFVGGPQPSCRSSQTKTPRQRNDVTETFDPFRW